MSGNPSRQQPPGEQTPAASLLAIRVKRKQDIAPSGKAGDLTQGQSGAAAAAPSPVPPAAVPVTSPVEALRRREAAAPAPASPSLPPAIMREAFASKPSAGKSVPQSPLAAKPMMPAGEIKPAAPAPQPPLAKAPGSPLNGATPPADDMPRENKAAAFLRDAPAHRVSAPTAPALTPPPPSARETKSAEPPHEAKPAEAKATDSKPVEAKASEGKAAEVKTPEAKAAEARDAKASSAPAAVPSAARDLPPWHAPGEATGESKAAAPSAPKSAAMPQPPTTATGPTARIEPPPLSDKLPESKPAESKPAESKPVESKPAAARPTSSASAPATTAPATEARPAPEPPRPTAKAPQGRRSADEIIDYWDGLRGGRDFPSLSELDRTMIAACWPNSVLLAFGSAEPPMPKISRIGEPNNEVEYTAMVTDWILSRGAQSVKRGEPMEEEQRFPVSTGMVRYRLLLLPFASQGAKCDHVLCHLARIEDLSPAAAFKRWLTS